MLSCDYTAPAAGSALFLACCSPFAHCMVPFPIQYNDAFMLTSSCWFWCQFFPAPGPKIQCSTSSALVVTSHLLRLGSSSPLFFHHPFAFPCISHCCLPAPFSHLAGCSSPAPSAVQGVTITVCPVIWCSWLAFVSGHLHTHKHMCTLAFLFAPATPGRWFCLML